MRWWAVILATLATVCAHGGPFVVGSKLFNESVILGEVATQLGLGAGVEVRHERQLGGSAFLFQGLTSGEVDVYPEYTGTLRRELLAGEAVESDAALRAALERRGVRMTGPIGFNNTYVIGVRRAVAERLGLRTISDLAAVEEPLRYGFSSEFVERGDGWPALRAAYGIGRSRVRGMDHELAYRGLRSGSVDVMDLYSTDAEIELYDIATLEDDLGFFPRYDAVFVYRADLAERAPGWVAQLEAAAGAIDGPAMIAMNVRAKTEDTDEGVIAADFLATRSALAGEATVAETAAGRVARMTVEHLVLVAAPMALGVLIATPIGVAAAWSPRFGQAATAVVGVGQTIPSLALLVVFIPLLGLGERPAIAALFVYALLPMVRSTQAGIASIAPGMIESARAIGLGPWRRLWLVELPLASRSVLSGIKTATVITIGFATLGAFIGAGGYGEAILTGIRRNDWVIVAQGAVPAAVMALAAQGVFELVERLVVPRGLNLGRSRQRSAASGRGV